jgi:hypothetical protein
MQCHLCPHQAAIRAGKYRRTAFKRTPCARCDWRERVRLNPSFKDERGFGEEASEGERTYVHRSHIDWRDYSTVDVPFPEEYEQETDPAVPLSVMSEAMMRLMALPAKSRDVVCWRFAGMRYAEIARRLGVTVAAAELRHRRALVQWPALRELFAEKAAKQLRRKPHARRDMG